MGEKTDLEITKVCALAMGINPRFRSGVILFVTEDRDGEAVTDIYDPLKDDAQAMAMVKKFGLEIFPVTDITGKQTGWSAWKDRMTQAVEGESKDLNRAICECVAKLGAKNE